MNYEIQSRSDFITGSYLVIRIPENEIDKHALHTIQEDCPDFIIPFHYKSIDGNIEFIYKVGTLCKLQYFSSVLTPGEYTRLWQGLLKPLLMCEDWFMNPGSFVINADYLYYDKEKSAVRYVYIPSTYVCSGNDAFYEMAAEVSKTITVSDAVLENKVLRAIIKDFNPLEFLKMLNDHNAEGLELQKTAPLNNNIEKQKNSVSTTEAVINDASYGFDSGVLEVNESASAISERPGLRCIGKTHLPTRIEVLIKEGEIFTIGRNDAAIGKRQSNFEFDKKTKAVSRRHAVIERGSDGYRIIDLSSSAGTFVNDKKVPPNTPINLETGSNVSFGNSGVNYIWEAD